MLMMCLWSHPKKMFQCDLFKYNAWKKCSSLDFCQLTALIRDANTTVVTNAKLALQLKDYYGPYCYHYQIDRVSFILCGDCGVILFSCAFHWHFTYRACRSLGARGHSWRCGLYESTGGTIKDLLHSVCLHVPHNLNAKLKTFVTHWASETFAFRVKSHMNH